MTTEAGGAALAEAGVGGPHLAQAHSPTRESFWWRAV